MNQQLVTQHWTSRLRNIAHALFTVVGLVMGAAWLLEEAVGTYTGLHPDWKLGTIGAGVVTASQFVDSTSFTRITSAAVGAWATFSSGGQQAPDAVLMPTGQAVQFPTPVTAPLTAPPTPADINRSAPLSDQTPTAPAAAEKPSEPALPPTS